ncbi:MAG: hypothetical protein CVU99_06670 [Firmicutes bacterium HGW-Firmicutes-4]|jgi:dTDP-4-amino-4,6-dideoxygalactose transaminase|nr:MAG: hypothetical protein CVU99_06670 [Firmicutes bacterium HGW-Firmicutes-4]
MRNQHPDTIFLNEVIEACNAWLECDVGLGATSQITGDGAIKAVETHFSELHENRPSLLVPSATYGIYSALKAVGVKGGDTVGCPSYDWPASYAAIKSIGAKPIILGVGSKTLTLSPESINKCDGLNVKAVIVTHVHGIPADVPAIRAVIGEDIAIIEDCSQALGSSLDGKPVGTMGDIAVFSFGPTKNLTAGEGGMVVCRDWELYEKMIREVCHPVRQIVGGAGDVVHYNNFSIRPHPMTAIMLWYQLRGLNLERRCRKNADYAKTLMNKYDICVIGNDHRRSNASSAIPAFLPSDLEEYPCECELDYTPSGAFDIKYMKPSKRKILLFRQPAFHASLN